MTLKFVLASTFLSLKSHLWAVSMIMILYSSAYTCNATVIASGEQYFFKRVEGRNGCADEGGGVFMGYLNKTCSAGATGSVYGPTVGPLLRAASTGPSWRQFTLTKVGTTALGEDLVEIKTHYPTSSKKPLCQGFVVPEKKGACNVEPLADKVHIHAKNGDVWAVSAVKGEKNTYTIRSYSRKPGCLKYLAVSAICSETYLQLDAKDDRSGRQHWTIIPAKKSVAAPPPRRKAPPPLAKSVEIPAVNYSIALTGYTSNTFGSPERTAFCDSILNSQTYPRSWMNCIVAFVTDLPFQGKSASRRRSMQGNTAYVLGYTSFRFVYGDADSQQQAGDAADGLYKNMSSPDTLQNIFNSSFPSSTITPDTVNRGEVEVPQSTLPTTQSPSSPSPSPTPASPSPTPSSPILSPDFNTVPGVITDGPVSSPTPSGGGGGGSGGGGGGPTTTVPGTPIVGVFTVNTGTTGNVNAMWSAPASDGGAPITTYDIKCQSSLSPPTIVNALGLPVASVCTGFSCSYLMTFSTSGTYTCTVLATNSVGPSPYSSTSFVVSLPIPNGYIANYNSNTVTKFNTASNSFEVATVNTGGNGVYGIAISGSTAYITMMDLTSITECIIVGGSFSSCTEPTVTSSGGLNVAVPAGIAISGSTAWIVNNFGDYITECTISGGIGGTITSCARATVTSVGEFNMNQPRFIAISGSTAYVTNSVGDSITECAISGGTMTSCTVPTVASGFLLDGPAGIAISGSTAFIVNNLDNSITECTISGGTIATCSVPTVTSVGGFNLNGPLGIAIYDSTAYITNNSDSTITECTITSGTITSCTVPTVTGAGGFNLDGPAGIAFA